MNNQRFVNNSKTFRSYFVVQFDKAFEDYGMWENQKDEIFSKKLREKVKAMELISNLKKGAKARRKPSSYISAEQAVITLNDELGKDKNLEATKARGYKTWNELLNRIQVEGGTDEQMNTFYSCLFRANLSSPVNSMNVRQTEKPYYYSPYDGKVYDGYMYTDNGFWDTFRSQFPLTNILHPTMQGRYMNACSPHRNNADGYHPGRLPVETGGMLGNHSISLLADACKAKQVSVPLIRKSIESIRARSYQTKVLGGANGRGF